MEKRAVIALVLSLLIFLAFGYFQKKMIPVAPPDTAPAPEKPSPVAPAPVPAPTVAAVPSSVPASPVAAASTHPAREVTVDTPLYRAVFTEQGARLKSFKLKKYWERLPFTTVTSLGLVWFSLDIEKYHTISTTPTDPQELVTTTALGDLPLGTSWESGATPAGPALPALYTASSPQLTLTEGGKGTLTFTHRSPDGLTLEKTLTFAGDSYRMDMKVTLRREGDEVVQGNLAVGLSADYTNVKSQGGVRGFVGSMNKKREDVTPASLKEPKTFTGKTEWAALELGYFMQALVPLADSKDLVTVQENPKGPMVLTLKTPVENLAPGHEISFPFAVYFGPLDIDILKSLNLGLEGAVDFGWFHFLAMPFFHVLKFFNGYVHNYGIAIIILTVLLRILFIYPNHKSYKSMQDMQKLQPKVAKLREKYKDDREALNKELMALYRTYKVNPAGGCLPMLLQLPVFIALYNLLAYAIELRHAPFIATLPFTNIVWLADLSAKDPLLITPLIMGATMFIQQKMTPSPGDPTQAKLMLFMPIVFTFMFLNFASGLVLYWLLNNVLSIIQQHYTNKYLGK